MAAPLLHFPLMLSLAPHLALQCSGCNAACKISLWAPCSIVRSLSVRRDDPSKTT